MPNEDEKKLLIKKKTDMLYVFKRNLHSAKRQLQAYKLENDDRDLELMCYSVHQSMENFLKLNIELSGGSYERTHNLEVLNRELISMGVDILPVNIETMIKQRSGWYIKLKYPSEISLNLRVALTVYEWLVEYDKEHYSKNSNNKPDISKSSHFNN